MGKIINLILTSNRQPWLATEASVRKAFRPHQDVTTIFYRGDSAENYIEDDVLHLTVKDIFIYTKTIAAFRFLLENFDFDYIFRSNNSSYVNYARYVAYLKSVPDSLRKHLYSGKIQGCKGAMYCSGCGYTISRNCVEMLVTANKKAEHEKQDDVMVGKILYENGIKPQDLPLIVLDEKMIRESSVPIHFHYRCKAATMQNYVPFIEEAFTYLSNQRHK